jgi:hypothetical protein
MVRHWWTHRFKVKSWRTKLLVNGIGLVLTGFILISMIVFKFFDGGWITLVITGCLIALAVVIKQHYYETAKMLRRLNNLVVAAESSEVFLPEGKDALQKPGVSFDPKAKTAVLLVNGFNGMGLHTLFGIIKMFSGIFKNFIFVHVGVVDAENFKGVEEMDHLNSHIKIELDRYVAFMNKHGYYAEGIPVVGVDVVDEITQLAPQVLERFPGAVFFGGQLIFPTDSFVSRLLHNYTVFTLQKKLYYEGIPFVILPIRV